MADAEDLRPVWDAYRTGDDAAAELLFTKYLSLANYLAKRALAKAPPHQDPEDIKSYAQHGLLDAMRKFDPDAGVKFETYATRRVTGAIIDGQRSQDPLARAMRTRVKQCIAATDALWEELQREPTAEELAERTELTVEEVREALASQKTMTSELNIQTVDETYAVHAEGEDGTQLADLRRKVAGRLASLDEDHLALLMTHYCEGMTIRQAAEALGVGQKWAQDRRADLLEALRP